MENPDPYDLQAALERVHAQASSENLLIAQHAHQETVEEDISLDDVLEAIAAGQIIENYPEHRSGPVACSMV